MPKKTNQKGVERFDSGLQRACTFLGSKFHFCKQPCKYETDLYFLQIFQSNMSVCLIISLFCKSCESIYEPEITPVLYHLEHLQKSKQKQFHSKCSVYNSYKTRKWTLLCIGNLYVIFWSKKNWNYPVKQQAHAKSLAVWLSTLFILVWPVWLQFGHCTVVGYLVRYMPFVVAPCKNPSKKRQI